MVYPTDYRYILDATSCVWRLTTRNSNRLRSDIKEGKLKPLSAYGVRLGYAYALSHLLEDYAPPAPTSDPRRLIG